MCLKVDDIRDLILLPEYAFLRENKYLKNNIMLLGLGGSLSYGTSIATSDIDLRGVHYTTSEQLYEFDKTEQFLDEKGTDTVIYGFKKMIYLLLQCNPNVIEICGLRPQDYLIKTKEGALLVDNIGKFLSKRAILSFGGFCKDQTRRLENSATVMDLADMEQHLMHSLEHQLLNMEQRYKSFDGGKFLLKLDVNKLQGYKKDILLDIELHDYPLEDLVALVSQTNSVTNTYNKLKKIGQDISMAKRCKHAMQLVRLYNMFFDLALKLEVITYREKEHDELMAVRENVNYEYITEAGMVTPKFKAITNRLEERFKFVAANSLLPDKPDFVAIHKMVSEITEIGFARMI